MFDRLVFLAVSKNALKQVHPRDYGGILRTKSGFVNFPNRQLTVRPLFFNTRLISQGGRTVRDTIFLPHHRSGSRPPETRQRVEGGVVCRSGLRKKTTSGRACPLMGGGAGNRCANQDVSASPRLCVFLDCTQVTAVTPVCIISPCT